MRRALLVLAAAVGLAVVPAGTASAHPLGNFTVNTADRLEVTSDGVQVLHVVDLAEIPTVQLAQQSAGVDSDADRALSDTELTAYAERECARVAPRLVLDVDGAQVALDVLESTGEKRPGTAGLATTRVTCTLLADRRPEREVSFDDPVASERNGWREVSAVSTCGPLIDASVPQDSRSALLTTYPEDLLSAPLDVTSARFGVDGGAACTGPVQPTGLAPESVTARSSGLTRSFTSFLSRPELTLPFAVLSFGAAVMFGVLHAMAPGHGKTVMAAYLVGQRGTRRQALQLGGIVTFTHTASVLALGGLLAAGALAAPELVIPVTEVIAGGLLVLVGVYLAVLAVRRLRTRPTAHHHHDHDHDRHHHDHADHDERWLVAPESAGGAALAVRPVVHTHGGRAHSHAPLPEGPLSWKALAGMGLAGGLVPSPSALLVLLSATALGRPLFGMLLVVAYGVGMAVTLTVAGLLLLRARAALERRRWTGRHVNTVLRLLPLGTAAVVVLVGVGLILRGLGTGQGLL